VPGQCTAASALSAESLSLRVAVYDRDQGRPPPDCCALRVQSAVRTNAPLLAHLARMRVYILMRFQIKRAPHTECIYCMAACKSHG